MDNLLTWFGLLENKTVLHWLVIWVGTVFPVYVFVVGSKFTFKELGQKISENWWMLLRLVLLTGLFVPLAAAGVVKLFSAFHMALVLGGIMLIAATAAGDPFDLVDAHGKKGGMLMASVVMVILVLVMPLTVPCWMWVFSHWFPLHLAASPGDVFSKVALIVLPPLFLGLLVRQFLPAIADILGNILHWYFKISAITLVIIFMPESIDKIITVFGFTGCLAMLIVTTITLCAGYYWAGGSDRKDRISISLACSLGNMAAVFLIAYHCYPQLSKGIDFLVTVLGWVVLRWAIIWAWYFFMKFRLARRGESLS